jgi:endonuclease/exonuclease/phosphatase family metal-dependent hydrolase
MVAHLTPRLEYGRLRPRALLAVALAALLLALGAAPAPAAPKDRELTVMTYNIHHGRGVDDVLDLERIAAVIRAEDVEVVALQEVDNGWGARSEFRDQARELAALLGMHFVYAANLDLEPLEPGSPRRQYGTAILSELPILQSENLLLPRSSIRNEQRGLLEALINVRGVPFRLYNTHLQHNSALDRTMQVEAIIDEMEEARGPHALLGDLNARPNAPELAPLFPRLSDAWTLGGEGDGFTLSASNPTARIDYVLVSPDIGVADARVPYTLASDHLPVVAELILPGSTVGIGRARTADERGSG